ncbi:hypothetical protein BDR22DRAFT_893139 [Usnea florida]
MSSLFYLLLSFLVPYFCSAMLANPPSLDLLSDSEIESATVQVETPSGNSIGVKCNSTSYGAGLNARSCANALAKSPTGERQESWAYHSRGGLNPPADVILPLVVVSDDAACLMIPLLNPSQGQGVTGHASAMNVSDAARAILQECVIRRRLGGFAPRIGGDNRVGVTLLKPSVQPTCAGTGTATTPPSSCRYIMDEMDKTAYLGDRFGRTGAVDFALPLTLRAPDGKCQVVIDTESPQFTVTTSWLQIWLAVEATVTLCVDNGKSGRAILPTSQAWRGLSISVMDEPDPSKVIAVSAKNASNESIYRA